MRKILIGTAAIAISALTTAYSMPVDAQGRGNGNGNAHEQQRGGGAEKGKSGQNRSRGHGNAGNKDSSGGQSAMRGAGRGNGKASAPSALPRVDAAPASGGHGARRADYYRTDERYRDNGSPFFARAGRAGNPGLIDGCPPGLAKKRNGCQPPGQARTNGYEASWFGLSGDGYRYRNGYMVRYGDSGIAGYIPLLGGALSIGRQWPEDFGVAQVPDYYRSYYNLGDDYRYYDNTLYRLDPGSAAITSIAALITGDDITVGQPMPRGYEVYNVPLGYRDRYRDRPDAQYRYSDGYIYQIDPETRLVAAAIELLT